MSKTNSFYEFGLGLQRVARAGREASFVMEAVGRALADLAEAWPTITYRYRTIYRRSWRTLWLKRPYCIKEPMIVARLHDNDYS